MKIKAFVLCCALALLSASCNNAVEFTADQLTIKDVATTSGYAWFNDEVTSYQPTTANVSALMSDYASDPFTTIVYVNPSCSCDGTHHHFPDLISTLRAAGIADSTVTIFSMRNAATKQPLSDKYPVTTLPTFYFVHQSSKVVSVIPPDGTTTGIDSMVVAAFK